MAVKESPPWGLLDSFDNPLWERVQLANAQPEWIVRSTHRGYEWMAIELRHSAVGLFSEGLDTTTVFLVRLPEASDEWYLPAARIASHRQVSVDRECVYLATLGESPRVRDWPYWLDMVADAADEVIRTRGTAPSPAARRAVNGRATEPTDQDETTWNPHDAQWVACWLFIMVPLAVAIVGVAFWEYRELTIHGAIVHCNKKEEWGYVLQGWKAKAYLGVVLSPLLPWCKMAHTMATRMHKPGFALRIHLEGIALLAVTYLGIQLLARICDSASGAC